jgi:hypothetical protein
MDGQVKAGLGRGTAWQEMEKNPDVLGVAASEKAMHER